METILQSSKKKQKKSDQNEKLKNSIETLETFFEQHANQDPKALTTFFENAHTYTMFPAILSKLFTVELQEPTKAVVEQTFLKLLTTWKEKLTEDFKKVSQNDTALENNDDMEQEYLPDDSESETSENDD